MPDAVRQMTYRVLGWSSDKAFRATIAASKLLAVAPSISPTTGGLEKAVLVLAAAISDLAEVVRQLKREDLRAPSGPPPVEAGAP